MFKKSDFNVGTIFTGNVNNERMEILKIKDGIVVIKSLDSLKTFTYGLDALIRCDVTINSYYGNRL